MDLNEYQKQTDKTAVYPQENAVNYLALGLNGESGEIAEKVKKHIRDDKELGENIEKELGDVLWYLAQLCSVLGTDLGTVAETNLDKLLDRKERGKIKGDGDNR